MQILKVRTLWGWYGIPIDFMIDYCVENRSNSCGKKLLKEEIEEMREEYSDEDDDYGELLDDFISNSDWCDVEHVAIKLPDDPLPKENDYDNDWFEGHPEYRNELYRIIEIKEK